MKEHSAETEVIYGLPYLMGERFRVSQGYGGKYSHTGESHYSLDFRMPENTPVCAAREGIVYRVIDHFSEGGTNPSFKPKANAIHILHEDDTIASYAHLIKNGVRVRSGQSIMAGELIGFSGSTGWSGYPHLHFHAADAAYHERFPTRFNTAERVETFLEVDSWYTRPVSDDLQIHTTNSESDRVFARPIGADNRDPFAFSPDLFELRGEVTAELQTNGFECLESYSSIDVLHDVHGLEVCGIRDPKIALRITRLLMRLCPGWTPGWLNCPDAASEQGWIATIQRNRDQEIEHWDSE